MIRLQGWNLALVGAGTLFLAARGHTEIALGVALGGLTGAANFWLNAWLIRRLLDPGQDTRGSGALILLKNLALWMGVGLLLLKVRPHGIGFGAGFCSILVTVTLWAAFRSLTGST